MATPEQVTVVPAVLQVAWAGTIPAPDNARKTPVGNSNLGNGSPAFFERARFMLSLVYWNWYYREIERPAAENRGQKHPLRLSRCDVG
ncbi:TPA: hypothetical protein ACK3Q6_000358 [Burkholderia cepacia]|nr:hypothetical protein [Burkholderia cepacia]